MLAVVALVNGQRRYYSLEDMPETNFDCRDKILGGYYADLEANCQMFHVCVKIPGQGVQDFRFLCPNETAFDQKNQICADSGDIDCAGSGLYYENFDLYRIGSSPAKRVPVPPSTGNKGSVLPLGPSTKSPILTNNVYEDDDYYLQKSETGDRRLHSKDILSSSSNFFNNRNKGKDLEEDEEETTTKKPEILNNSQYRPRPSQQFRPKTQFQSQFRKQTEQTPTTQQTVVENQNQLNDKKRTKIAVRKLTRKRPEDEVTVRPTQAPQQPGFSSFTTQVTQKFGGFGDSNSKYNTVSRPTTTTLAPVSGANGDVFKQNLPQGSQQNFPQQQSRFPPFKKIEQTTPAFYESSPTVAGLKNPEPTTDTKKETTAFSLLKNPIVAAGSNYNQNNRGNNNNNFQQQNRQTTANYPQTSANGVLPASTTNGNFQNQNYPQQQQQQQQQEQQKFNRPGNINFPQQQQQNRVNTPATQNFQQSRQFPNTQQNYPEQQQQNQQQSLTNRQNPTLRTSNFPQQRQNGNSPLPQQQQQPQQGVSTNGNFQQNRQQVNNGVAQNRGQNYNNQQTSTSQQSYEAQGSRQYNQRQTYSRNLEEFDDGDNQEFLKTAPSNNFRPSDLNSFANNNYKNYDTPRQNFYSSSQSSTNQPGNSYSPTGSPSQKPDLPQPSSPSRPLPQRIYPSPTAPPKQTEKKDVAYDYAYYDDAGSFSDYGSSFDHLEVIDLVVVFDSHYEGRKKSLTSIRT
ncbi:conserved hypothetical protein [Pediculus humanus corporis]|uniref:Chitin-binding type-2 domain-containing protein n=1 Tax=Pediculus humanus subsp. corporis TaxID=121224 RepID=E0W1D3_PEDHC|nr:uncharacterized protein Phum_PHUM575010 [Pediculus humanus corporis]EEB19439.1 conserved hypothetical protein [Pediculus humanus corporis]